MLTNPLRASPARLATAFFLRPLEAADATCRVLGPPRDVISLLKLPGSTQKLLRRRDRESPLRGERQGKRHVVVVSTSSEGEFLMRGRTSFSWKFSLLPNVAYVSTGRRA